MRVLRAVIRALRALLIPAFPMLILNFGIFAQAPPPAVVHVFDTAYYPFGAPSGLGQCTGSLTGQSAITTVIGTSTVLPTPSTVRVVNGILDVWVLPNINGVTSYSLSLNCRNGTQQSPVSQTWVVPTPSPNPLSITGATTPTPLGSTWTVTLTVSTGSLGAWTLGQNGYLSSAANPSYQTGYVVTAIGSGTITVAASTTPSSQGTVTPLIPIPTASWTSTGTLTNAGPLLLSQVASATVPIPSAQILLSQIANSGCVNGQLAFFNGSSWGCSNAAVNPMNVLGALIVGGVGGAETQLSPGSNTQILTMVSGSPAWAVPSLSGPGSSTAGWVPTWASGSGNQLAQGFPVTVTSAANSVVESNSSGKIDTSQFPFVYSATPAATTIPVAGSGGQLAAGWMPAYSGVVQTSAGGVTTTFTSPSGSGGTVMVGTGTFTSGHCLQITAGNVVDAGVACATGSITGPGTTVTGYVPTWGNSTGSQLASGFAVSSSPGLNTIPQTDGTSTIPSGFAWALTGVVQSTAGSVSTSLTNPTGTGAKVVTGTGSYTIGHCLQVGSGLDAVDAGGACGTGSGNVVGPGSVTSGYLATWGGSSNTLTAGLAVATAAAANTVPEAGLGGTLATSWLQTANLSQIGLGNVLGTGNQITSSYAGGTATLSLANPLTLPGPTTFAAATTGGASLVVPNGIAPTSPTAGAIWAASNVPYFYNGSSTQSFVLSGFALSVNAPLTSTGSFATSQNLGIETATSSVLGAGNVAGTSGQILAPYSGGTATLALANPLTFPGRAVTTASTTSAAGLNLPVGSAPTSPVAGDVWNAANVLYFRAASTTQSLLTSATAPGGDISGTFGALTVVNVNGVSYPATPSTGGVPVVTGSNTVAYDVLPSCPDTGGNHLNWTGSAWACGTTGGTAGNVGFSGVLTGTSTVALLMGSGGSLGVTGTGTINATSVNGVSYPAAPSTNTVPVVTGSNTITYEALPNAALQNSGVTVAATANQTTVTGGALSLGGTVTVGTVQSIGTSSTPQFSALGIGAVAGAANTVTIGSTTLASGGSGTQTFPASTGTVINTGTSGLVANGMLANSSVTLNTSSPLSGGGSVALGGSTTFSVATATASAIGAGNVVGGTSVNTPLSVVTAPYSGGTATLGLADPTNLDVVTSTTLSSTSNISSGGNVYSANAFNAAYLGTSVSSALYASGVTLSGTSPWTCVFVFTGGGGSGATFQTSYSGSPGALPAASLTLVNGGSLYTSNPTGVTVSGTGCSGSGVVFGTSLTPGSLHLHDPQGNDVPLFATTSATDQLTGSLILIPPAVAGGAPPIVLDVATPNNASLTSTNPSVYFNLGGTQTYSTLPSAYIAIAGQSPTVAGSGSIPQSVFMSLPGAPITGTGVTAGFAAGLRVISGNMTVGGGAVTNGISALFMTPTNATNNYSLVLGDTNNSSPTFKVTFDASGNEVTQGNVTAATLISSTIKDANGNPFIASTATASAVDSLTITPSAAGSPGVVIMGTTGSDSNISLDFVAKGTGNIVFPIQNAASSVIVKAASAPTQPAFIIENSSGVSQANFDKNFNLDVQVIEGSGAAPTLTCTGSGAGTGPTCGANTTGTDMSGTISLTTGSSPGGSAAQIVAVGFVSTHTAAPNACMITPGNAAASGLAVAAVPHASTISSSGFQLTAGSSGLTAATPYVWYYLCL